MAPRPAWTDLARSIRSNLVNQPLVVHLLRIIACFTVWTVELGFFWPATAKCRSVLGTEAATAPIQVLVLADPQIITTAPHPSYPGVVGLLSYPLVSLLTDRYLARSWRALRSPGGVIRDWTATVWLGDLTDTGRAHYIDQGLSKLYNRFFRIFPEDDSSSWNHTFYIPGNHDTALKQHDGWRDRWEYSALQTREYSRWKFLRLFGTNVWDGNWDASPIFPPHLLSHTLYKEQPASKYSTKLDHKSRRTFSARVSIDVAHSDGSPQSKIAELILLDATDIVSLQRMHRSPWEVPKDGKPGAEADWRHGGSWWFVDAMSKDRDPSIPRILFTHIPLYREPSPTPEACVLPEVATFPPGVMPALNPDISRQSTSSIQMGTDTEGTYENMIGKEWSRFILDKIQPNVVFSGDDHDHCHHLHQSVVTAQSWGIPELTVNALSLTSGVRTPGYARLSIWQESGETKISYAPCALPRQIELWATIYPLLVVLVALLLPLHRVCFRRGLGRGRSRSMLAASSKPWLDGGETGEAGGGEEDLNENLPMQDRRSRRSHESSSPSSSSSSSSQRRRSSSRNSSRRGRDDDAEAEGSQRAEGEGEGEGEGEDEEESFIGNNGRNRIRRGRSGRGSSPSNTPAARRSTHTHTHTHTRSHARLFLHQWAREFRDVAWVPLLYWVLLFIFGF